MNVHVLTFRGSNSAIFFSQLSTLKGKNFLYHGTEFAPIGANSFLLLVDSSLEGLCIFWLFWKLSSSKSNKVIKVVSLCKNGKKKKKKKKKK